MRGQDKFGVRMKEYESVSDIKLVRKVPVVCRVDQRGGSAFTRGLAKPYDGVYLEVMKRTLRETSKGIGGCVFGYTQSDELSFVLTDYRTVATEGFFGYRVQKMSSVIASMVTKNFNKYFRDVVEEYAELGKLEKPLDVYTGKYDKAEFDCRVFNVPKEEVVNVIYWRQKDAERNSIRGLGQSMYSHKELKGINNEELKAKIGREKGIEWDKQSADKKWGCSCYKENYTQLKGTVIEDKCGNTRELQEDNERIRWVIDEEMPKLVGGDREYLERWL